jgi:hypothetical protein
MARRNLVVEISGDASQLNKAFGQAGSSAQRFEGRMDSFGKRTAGAFKIAGAAAAGFGAVGAVGIKKFADAAIESEKSQARMVAQLRASGLSFQEHAAQIEKSIQATSRLSALDDEDLQDSFTAIVRTTGDVNEALRLNALAADISRAKNIDVAKAGELVAKVSGGNTGILARYGVTIRDGASATEALGALQQKFAGQAEAYGKTTGGAIDRAKVAFENTAEILGTALAPTIQRVANTVARFVEQMQTGTGAGGGFARKMMDLGNVMGDVFAVIRRVANGIRSVLPGAFGDARQAVTRFASQNRESIETVRETIRDALVGIRALFDNVLVPAFRAAVSVARKVLPGLTSAVRGVLEAIGGIVKVFKGVFTGDFRRRGPASRTRSAAACEREGHLERRCRRPGRDRQGPGQGDHPRHRRRREGPTGRPGRRGQGRRQGRPGHGQERAGIARHRGRR